MKKKKQPLKLPPKILTKQSSTFFLPASEERSPQKRNARALSDDIQMKSDIKQCMRKLSLVVDNTNFSINSSLSQSCSSFNEKKCTICCEAECNSVFMDCGHGGICFSCACKILEENSQCFMCRKKIAQVLKIKQDSNKVIEVIGTKVDLS